MAGRKKGAMVEVEDVFLCVLYMLRFSRFEIEEAIYESSYFFTIAGDLIRCLCDLGMMMMYTCDQLRTKHTRLGATNSSRWITRKWCFG